MIFQQQIQVQAYLCDSNDQLHLWAAVRLCQEISEQHSQLAEGETDTLSAQNKAWVITRAYYEIQQLPHAHDPITLCTWSRGHNGLIAYRDYRILSSTGQPLLLGTSYWVIIDTNTRRPLRLGHIVDNYQPHVENATQITQIERLAADVQFSNTASHMLQRTVTNSMIDHTHHVNNAEYIRLLSDLLYQHDLLPTSHFNLTINYNHETRLPDTLVATATGNAIEKIVNIYNSSQNCTTARVRLL